MTDTTVVALTGLGGALVGAFAALGAQLLAVTHQRKAERRRELVELVSRFWDAADRLWRSSLELEDAVTALMHWRDGGESEARRVYEARRAQEIEVKRAAERDALFLLAQMRLLHPRVSAAAQALVDASRVVNVQHRIDLQTAREQALVVFEEEARKLLASAD